jgi:hypothetical protein
MSEKPETDDFDDEEPEELTAEVEVLDVDKVMRALDAGKKRGQKVADPAWRKLERMREERATREMIKDFEDYEIGLDSASPRPRTHRHA